MYILNILILLLIHRSLIYMTNILEAIQGFKNITYS